MLTSKIITSAPQKPKAPEFPSLWRSCLTGTVFQTNSADKLITISIYAHCIFSRS
jgi:hypothetical protein